MVVIEARDSLAPDDSRNERRTRRGFDLFTASRTYPARHDLACEERIGSFYIHVNDEPRHGARK